MAADPEVRIAFMTSPELEAAVARRPTVIIPTGSTEVLGRHGALGVDTLIADRAGADIAREASCLMAPAIPYGDAFELRGWAGTVTVRMEVLTRLYEDVADSLLRAGFRRVFFLNVHSMNGTAADQVCRALRARGVAAASGAFWRTAMEEAAGLTVDTVAPTAHGGEVITSVALALSPDLVRLAEAANEPPKAGAGYYFSHLPGGSSPFAAYGDFTDYCESGAWGDVSAANAETGREIYDRTVRRFVAFLAEFNGNPEPEVTG